VIAILFRLFLFGLRLVPNRHVIEQLANQTKRIHDVVVFASRSVMRGNYGSLTAKQMALK
jgi:hypothetical protein